MLFLVGNIVVYYYYYYFIFFLHIQLSCTIKTIIQHLTMGVFFMCTKFPSLLVNHPLNLRNFFSLFSFLFVNLCKLRLMSQSSFQNFSPPNGLLNKKNWPFYWKKYLWIQGKPLIAYGWFVGTIIHFVIHVGSWVNCLLEFYCILVWVVEVKLVVILLKFLCKCW